MRAGALALALLPCLFAACATIEAPGGGPADITPPELVGSYPDSGAVGLAPFREIELAFSEKMNPVPFAKAVHLYPPLEIEKGKWSGRRVLRITLADSVPADTVLVVEVPSGLADNHKVSAGRPWSFPLATADSLPPGEISGWLVMDRKPLAGAVVELYDTPPDSIDLIRQPLLRRAATDSMGRFILPWLPASGESWRLRAFADSDGDMRASERDGRRVFPYDVMLTAAAPRVELEPLAIYAPGEPGRLICGPVDPGPWTGEVFGLPLGIAEEDTGFVPALSRKAPKGQVLCAPGDSTIFDPAGPGLVRVVCFVDVDRDSLFGALPDSSLMPDTLLWVWEPHAVADSLEVEPGLPARFVAPLFPGTLVECLTAPQPKIVAVADSLSVRASVDSMAAASFDTAAAAVADSASAAAPPDTSAATGP